MQSPLINPYSSIKLLHESGEDYYTIKWRGDNIPLYKFAKGYTINTYGGDKRTISAGKGVLIVVHNKLKSVGERLKYYEENKDKTCSDEILNRDFIKNNINSGQCFRAANALKGDYKRLESRYKALDKEEKEKRRQRMNQYNKKYKH